MLKPFRKVVFDLADEPGVNNERLVQPVRPVAVQKDAAHLVA